MDRATATRKLIGMVKSRIEELNRGPEFYKLTKRLGKRRFNLLLTGQLRQLGRGQVRKAFSGLGFGDEESKEGMAFFVVGRQAVRHRPQPRMRWRGSERHIRFKSHRR